MAGDEKLTTYLFRYQYGNSAYVVDVPAYSLAEARGRVKAMALARYDGELVTRIPAGPGVGLFVRVLTSLRNRFAGGRS